ncbi:MAG: tetratricopeptide repeat protein [Acidobacteria bacterium]|nr:tetratricopeptide repeat protein [Acidobacteriota bacterium]
MKRTERRHLKENEVQNFVRVAREMFETRRGESTLVIGLVAALLLGALAYYGWREHVQSRATALLADAMTVQDARIGPPPAPGTPANGIYFPTERERAQAALTKFKIAADAYPSADAGIYARYQLASTYMTLGQPAQAATAYQQVIDAAGTGIYGQMARLGLAEAQARAGQYDQAINTFKDLSLRKDGPLPVDGILMQLGRVYLNAGKRTEAQQTFNRLVDEFPESPFTGDARKELDNLKKI